MKSRNPSVSANAEPAPLAGEPKCIYSSRSRPERPSSVSLTRASSPGGEAFNLPLRGRGTAAVGGGGRGALRERAVCMLRFSYRSRSLRPSSVRASALPAPPLGKLFLPTFPSGAMSST